MWNRRVKLYSPFTTYYFTKVHKKIAEANDCSFNTNALSEAVQPPQTRNSNHSANQTQSISQACLWQTELLSCHPLQPSRFCPPSHSLELSRLKLIKIQSQALSLSHLLPLNPVWMIWLTSLRLFL